VQVKDFGGIDQGLNVPTDTVGDAPPRAAKPTQASGNGASARSTTKSKSAKAPVRKGRR